MSAKKTKREEKSLNESSRVRAALNAERSVKDLNQEIFERASAAFKKGGSVHDSFFHFMLKIPVFAVRFLNAYLPEELLAALDLSDPSNIKILSSDYYDKRLNKHIADLIFLVRCKGEDARVALKLVVEHKAQSGSLVDRKTVAQTLKYAALEIEEQLKKTPNEKIVYQPLVVLFYTGSDPTFEAPSWESCFPLPELLRVEKLREAQIRFRPLCVNLTRMFLEDKLSKKDFLRVMPEIMARASLKQLADHMRRCLAR